MGEIACCLIAMSVYLCIKEYVCEPAGSLQL